MFQALSDNEQSLALFEEAARIAYMFEDFRSCIEYNQKALALKKLSMQDKNYCNIGIAYLELQDYNEAIEALNKSIEINPKSTNSLINLALVYKHLGNLDKAIKILNGV